MQTLRKRISCDCKYKFDGKNVIEINGRVTINVGVSVKNVASVKKIIFGILLCVVAEIWKYLASIMDDWAIMCDKL